MKFLNNHTSKVLKLNGVQMKSQGADHKMFGVVAHVFPHLSFSLKYKSRKSQY